MRGKRSIVRALAKAAGWSVSDQRLGGAPTARPGDPPGRSPSACRSFPSAGRRSSSWRPSSRRWRRSPEPDVAAAHGADDGRAALAAAEQSATVADLSQVEQPGDGQGHVPGVTDPKSQERIAPNNGRPHGCLRKAVKEAVSLELPRQFLPPAGCAELPKGGVRLDGWLRADRRGTRSS